MSQILGSLNKLISLQACKNTEKKKIKKQKGKQKKRKVGSSSSSSSSSTSSSSENSTDRDNDSSVEVSNNQSAGVRSTQADDTAKAAEIQQDVSRVEDDRFYEGEHQEEEEWQEESKITEGLEDLIPITKVTEKVKEMLTGASVPLLVFIAEYKGQLVVMFVKQSPEILRLQSSFQQFVREIEKWKVEKSAGDKGSLGKEERGRFWRVDVGKE